MITFHVFQCYKLRREYLRLLTKYSCGPSDGMFNINVNVICRFKAKFHYASWFCLFCLLTVILLSASSCE